MDTIAYFAGDYFYADTRTFKEPILFDILHLSTSSSSYTNIEATFLMEAGSVSSASDEYPYDSEWVYAQWVGENNEECNEQQGSDSAQKLLSRDLNKDIVYRNQSVAFYLVYPEVTCIDPAGSECMSNHGLPQFPQENLYNGSLRNPNDVLDNLFDFFLFLNDNNLDNFATCLDVDEMNFYYEAMKDVALAHVPYPPSNRVVSNLFVGWDRFVGFKTVIWHPMKVITASKITTDENNSLPLPCHCN